MIERENETIQAIAVLRKLMADMPRGRELSLAATKLDEFEMWLAAAEKSSNWPVTDMGLQGIKAGKPVRTAPPGVNIDGYQMPLSPSQQRSVDHIRKEEGIPPMDRESAIKLREEMESLRGMYLATSSTRAG